MVHGKIPMSESEKRLRALFLAHADEHDKKHGKWALFYFKKEDTYLTMDTWNGSFHYRKEPFEYNYWTGFNGESVYYFGLNESWRASDPPKYPDNVFDYFYEKIKGELNGR